MAALKINFILVIFAAVFISKAACLHSALATKEFQALRFRTQLGIVCNKSEADTEFAVLVNKTFTDFMTCIDGSFQAAKDHRNDGQLFIPAFNSKIKSLCYAGPSLINCYHNMSKPFEFCYSETQLKQNKIMLKFLDQFQILMCKDQGQRIINFQDKIECISNHTDLKSCFKKELDIIETLKNLTPIEIQSTKAFDYLLDNCTRIQEIENCIVKDLSQCEDEKNVQISTEDSPAFYSLENTTRETFSLLKNAMECKKKEVQKPQVSIVES